MTPTPEQQQHLRSLPAIGELLEHDTVVAWLTNHPRAIVVEAIQHAVDRMRDNLLRSENDSGNLESSVIAFATDRLEATTKPSLRRVINATGVVLHTGLGRSPLSEDAVRAIVDCASGYCNLEIDINTGKRGKRTDHVAALLADLTGAEAATVVNNNAAATLLILNTIARGAEVIVSRGELVEIGGSYRLPEMMAAGGAILREVGTTNRTRAADYERAIGDETAALMRVHTSNYKVVGFTEAATLAELVALGRRYGKTVIDDLGSGAMFDMADAGLAEEPSVRASVAAGADLVCFSGDKLLGGPQAGIIAGRRDLIARIEANPLMRTYRVGKLTLAALEATLRACRDEPNARESIPALTMLTTDEAAITKRAQRLLRKLRNALPTEQFEIVQDNSLAGGGSMPTQSLPTSCVAWTPQETKVDEALTQLRQADPPILARASENRILFDLRTIQEAEYADLTTAIKQTTSKE